MSRWSAGVARCSTAIRTLSPRAVLAIGFGLFVLYAFPGYMSNDSVVQLLEGRDWLFSDAHPPLMAAEWGVLDAIVSGPILMLLLQGALFLGGLYGLMCHVLTPRRAAIAAVVVLLFPPVMTPMAVIWKDSQMAAYLVAGVAALLSERRRIRLLGLVLIVAGGAMRHNAFAAVVPLVFMLFEWRPGMRWWLRFPISFAAAILVVAASMGVTRALTSKHVVMTPTYGDIEGTLRYSPDRSDDDLRHLLRGTPLHVHEQFQANLRTGLVPLFDQPKTPEESAAITRVWKELIVSEFGAYLRYRWVNFANLIGLDGGPLRAPVWNLFLERPDEMSWVTHDASRSPTQQRVSLDLIWLSNETPLFRPYVYIFVALALLVLCCRDRVTFALFGSALLYELSYLPAGGAPDYRYSHWMITCTTIAAVLLFVQRMQPRPRAPRTTP